MLQTRIQAVTAAAQPTEERRLSWRKRHPVISRTLLYGLGLALAGLIVFLLAGRQREDAADQVVAARMELLGMPATLMPDPANDGRFLAARLEARYPEAGLDASLLPLRLRILALAQRRHDPEAAEATLARAAGLAMSAPDRSALQLEWAEARLEREATSAALALLRDERVVHEGAGAILRVLLEASALAQAEDPDAAAFLEAALAALPVPLPEVTVDPDEAWEAGGRPWTPVQAATVATETLVALRGQDTDPAPWKRLVRLAPDDVDAQLRAAAALAGMQRMEAAASVWRRALALDEDAAREFARRDPRLNPLHTDSSQGGNRPRR